MVGIKTITNTNEAEFDFEVSEFLSGLNGKWEITFHPQMNEKMGFVMHIAHIIY